jgi:hypothetical protein
MLAWQSEQRGLCCSPYDQLLLKLSIRIICHGRAHTARPCTLWRNTGSPAHAGGWTDVNRLAAMSALSRFPIAHFSIVFPADGRLHKYYPAIPPP